MQKGNRLIHISFMSVDFKCPYCGTKQIDENDKILNRINKNKQGWTRVCCTKCEKRMGVTTAINKLQGFCISEEKRPCDCWLEVGGCYCPLDARDDEPEPQLEI